MSEFDWASCEQPELLARSLGKKFVGRKFQLLLSAGGRYLLSAIANRPLLLAGENLERFVDGEIDETTFRANEEQFISAATKGYGFDTSLGFMSSMFQASNAILAADTKTGFQSLLQYGELAIEMGRDDFEIPMTCSLFHARMCALFREIFPHPDRDYVHRPEFAGGGLLLPDGEVYRVPETARCIAEGICRDQAFDRLPILADALEDADCPDRDWLDHLRHGKNHTRGCWALDLVLGRN